MERQYIGARYVPKFWDNGSGSTDWTPNIPYDSMIVVTYMNNSYTSKVPVPATQVTPNIDTEHWALTGAYNAQVEQYRKDVEKVEEAIATIISGGDAIGAVVMYGKGEKEFLGTAERQLVISAANFLGRQME